MMDLDPGRERRWLHWFAQAGGALAASLGGVALLGWALGQQELASFGAQFIPMAPSTALLFGVAGLTTFSCARWPHSRLTQRAGRLGGIGVAVISLVLLVLSAQGIYLEVESLGWSVAGAIAGAPLGHMSPVTALSFLLTSVSLLMWLSSAEGRSWRAAITLGLAILVSLTHYVFALAYFAGMPLLYGKDFIPPALPTNLACLTLGLALMALAQAQLRFRGRSDEKAPVRVAYTLLAIFAVLALSIIALVYVYYRNYENQYRAEVEGQLAAIAELKASEIVQWRKERLGDGLVLFANAAFFDLAQRYFEQPSDGESAEHLQTWLRQVYNSYEYSRVMLLDVEGRVRLSFPAATESGDIQLSSAIAEALQFRQVVFQDFYRTATDQAIHLAVVVPVVEREKSDRVIGVVVLSIDPERYLYPSIERWPVPSETAETLLVRREGDSVLFLNDLRFRADAALNLRLSLKRANVAAVMAVRGQTGVVEGVDYRGVPVLAALRSIPHSPWFMVARRDRAEVYAPLQARLGEMVGLMAGLLFSAGAGLGLIWRQQRLRHYRERYAIERERAWLHDVMARSLNEIYVFDPQSLRFIYANQGACQNIGYALSELTNLTPLDLKPEFTPETFAALLQPLRSGERERLVFETIHRRKDGTTYPVEIHLQHMLARTGTVFLAMINDITDRRRAETRIRKLNRVYALLSDINQAIVRIREPRALFEKVCRIAVEVGGFQLAWIGLGDETHRQMQVVASVGGSDAYFKAFDLTWWEADSHDCPVKRALHHGQHTACDLIGRDVPPGACQQIALQSGIRSMAAFPLLVFGRIRGTINFYSAEPDFFDEDEIDLLDELAMDLSFSMEFTEKAAERQAAEMEIRRLNADLEQRVEQRTAQLQAANRELEAFTYSVSHDLRAPLRAIDGFSHILQEDYADHFDAEGQRLFGIVRDNAQKMDQLITDLLALSRVTRTELLSSRIDMAALAQTVYADVAAPEVQAQFTFTVAPLPAAHGDAVLLKQVWVNLLSNAIKYTLSKPARQIEVGGYRQDGESVYFVKDSGVGFNPAYAHKLFGVFQRLHKAEEFEGTGVGLAIVQRIVQRHGGRVWGDGQVDRGATFYFSLPHPEADDEPSL